MDIVIEGMGADAFAESLAIKNIWVKPNAVRINGADDVLTQDLLERGTKLGFDVNCVPDGLSIKNFGILTLDMDSTLIELECIDDIAWQCGVGEEVARMTEIAMQGHMPFAEYLRERVKLFKGAPAHYMDVTATHAKLMPGAVELINFAKAHGLKTYILSGGFDAIAKVVCEKLGMTGYLCNHLIMKDGYFTGETTGPGGGEILDAAGKRRALDMLCAAARGSSPRPPRLRDRKLRKAVPMMRRPLRLLCPNRISQKQESAACAAQRLRLLMRPDPASTCPNLTPRQRSLMQSLH